MHSEQDSELVLLPLLLQPITTVHPTSPPQASVEQLTRPPPLTMLNPPETTTTVTPTTLNPTTVAPTTSPTANPTNVPTTVPLGCDQICPSLSTPGTCNTETLCGQCVWVQNACQVETRWLGYTEIGQTHVVRTVGETRRAPRIVAERDYGQFRQHSPKYHCH